MISDDEKPYCLNCGRPVETGQVKCECGYEFKDFKCPHCGEMNEYANRFCTSCGKGLWSSSVKFPDAAPKGCVFGDRLILDSEFLERELVKTPHQKNGEISTDVLHTQHLMHARLIDEICSRWAIVSPSSCISCKGRIDPPQNICPKCGIRHYGSNDKGIMEIKSMKNNYVKTERDVKELSRLKWTYKISDTDRDDYFLSLEPMIGESQFDYRQRLFNEYGENCAIQFIINCEWDIYFENICINCGANFEKYELNCPQCGMKKNVPALSVMLNDDSVEMERFAGQFDDFSRCLGQVCAENGADTGYIDEGIAQCPGCMNYFHYLTRDFMETHKCPHCGAHFSFTATIYQDEWDREGLSYDEYMETYYGVRR